MHSREAIAAGGGNFRDTMRVALVMVLFGVVPAGPTRSGASLRRDRASTAGARAGVPGRWPLVVAEAAASRGVPNLEADVLVTNGRMLTLLRSRGYATVGSDDWSALRLVVGTAGRTPTWPHESGPGGPNDRPRVLVEVPGGRWHAGKEAAEAGLKVMACSGPGGIRRPRCPVLEGRPCPLAAEADAIVVSNVPDEERWHAIVDAHADLHPGVPVCVEPRSSPPGRSRFIPRDGDTAVVIDDDDPRLVVSLVDRLVAAHRRTRDTGRGPKLG